MVVVPGSGHPGLHRAQPVGLGLRCTAPFAGRGANCWLDLPPAARAGNLDPVPGRGLAVAQFAPPRNPQQLHAAPDPGQPGAAADGSCLEPGAVGTRLPADGTPWTIQVGGMGGAAGWDRYFWSDLGFLAAVGLRPGRDLRTGPSFVHPGRGGSTGGRHSLDAPRYEESPSR